LTEWIKDNWKKYAIWIGLCVVALTANHFFNTTIPLPMPPQEYKVADGKYDAGWSNDPAAVKAVADTLRIQTFADTPAGQVADPLPNQFYQWEVYKKIDPRGPPAKNQNPIGSCVSFGTNNAILRTMACQIVMNGAAEELKDIAEEVTYAGSRVEIGGGRLRGGDGSVGAWAAQFVQKWGVVNRGVHGVHDLTKYDPARCRAWGNTGVPADLEVIAREHPVKDTTLVKSWADAKRALSQGYGIAVCSNQGFSMQRDSRGVARAQGSWAHCMCIDGYHVDTDGKEYGHIENSWGANTMTGPTGWGNPSGAGFWADAAVVERMIKNGGDTWAFSGVRGFPSRLPAWFVHNNQPARQDTRLAFLDLKRKDSVPCVLYSSAP
jgi:hypothetical protein